MPTITDQTASDQSGEPDSFGPPATDALLAAFERRIPEINRQMAQMQQEYLNRAKSLFTVRGGVVTATPKGTNPE